MHPERIYRARDLITYPHRQGVLPYSETHFYRLLKSGKLPPPDIEINGTRMWSGASLLHVIKLRADQSTSDHSTA